MCRAKRGPQCRRPKIPRVIVFNDVLTIHKNLDYENDNFSKYKKFSRGLTHDFDPKIQIFLYLFLVKIRLRIVLDNAVDKSLLLRL